MARIPILAKQDEKMREGRIGCRNKTALARPLPAFYMVDYSVLGFLVDSLERAVHALKAADYSVITANGDHEVIVDHFGEIEAIRRVLIAKGIDTEFADVVGGIYQG